MQAQGLEAKDCLLLPSEQKQQNCYVSVLLAFFFFFLMAKTITASRNAMILRQGELFDGCENAKCDYLIPLQSPCPSHGAVLRRPEDF